MSAAPRPEIRFIPLSTDPAKIRFFGTLMPALLLLKASPGRFAHFQVARHTTPRVDIPAFIASHTDDAARAGDVMIFVHRWHSDGFDPLAFAQARTSLSRLTRLVRRGLLSQHVYEEIASQIDERLQNTYSQEWMAPPLLEPSGSDDATD